MDEERAWQEIAHPDEKVREKAYKDLWRHLHAGLENYLIGKRANRSDAEDAVQMAFLKLHKTACIQNWPNERAGRAWLYRTAKTCYIDILRQQTIARAPSSGQDTPSPINVAQHAQASVLLEELLHYADAFWLGLDPALPAAAYTRRLLVAQMYYLEGIPPAEICHLLGCPLDEEAEITPAVVVAWVRDPGVVRLLVYHTLLLSQPDLLACLLGLKAKELSSEVLNALWLRALAMPPEALAWGEMTWGIVVLILFEYRHKTSGSGGSPLAFYKQQGYSEEQIHEQIKVIKAQLPFAPLMRRLLDLLEDVEVEGQKILESAGLWKRLAFQYWYRKDLSLLDVYDRIQPAAELVDYRLNPNMLNTWLSGGQLRKQLLKFWVNHKGGEADE